MKITLLLGIISFCNFLGYGQEEIANNIKPFEQIDFRTDEWLLVFNNIIHPDSKKLGLSMLDENLSIINDEQILDSLKSEFSYNPDKQLINKALFESTFIISLYKNNTLFEAYSFEDQSDFDFGKLHGYFQAIEGKDVVILGINKLKHKKKKLLAENIDFYYSSEYGIKSHFTFKIKMSFNTDSIINYIRNKGPNDTRNYMTYKDEEASKFIKNIPELKNKNSHFTYGRKGNYEYLIMRFSCTSEFTIDPENLKKNNGNFIYEIIGTEPTEYRLTTLIK